MDRQRTLFGDPIPTADDTAAEPNSDDDPPEKPCDVCDRTVPIDGKTATEHGGQVLCKECTSHPVAFEAFCESCGWTRHEDGTEFNRWAVRQLVQQAANSHESEKRVFESIPHETDWREVEPPDAEFTTSEVYDALREAYENGETGSLGHGVRVHVIADRLPNSRKNILSHLALLRERGDVEQTIELGDQGPSLCGYRPTGSDRDGSTK